MYTIIINPTSGHGSAAERLAVIEKVLKARALDYTIKESGSAEETTVLAREASSGTSEGIIAVGGDGTLFRIINGMVNSDTPLIFVASGTGNDFVKSLKLPKDTEEALNCQLDAPISRIDVGRMNDIHFLNVSGTGFDVDVLRQTEKYKSKYTGLRAYMCGLYDAIKHYKPVTASVEIDDGPEELLTFAILSIGNGRYIGGGMKAVPEAEVNDGLFDVIAVKPVKKATIFALVFLFVAGLHVKLGLGKLRRCKKITIRRPDTTYNIDGELYPVDEAKFEILEKALAVRIPAKK